MHVVKLKPLRAYIYYRIEGFLEPTYLSFKTMLNHVEFHLTPPPLLPSSPTSPQPQHVHSVNKRFLFKIKSKQNIQLLNTETYQSINLL